MIPGFFRHIRQPFFKLLCTIDNTMDFSQFPYVFFTESTYFTLFLYMIVFKKCSHTICRKLCIFPVRGLSGNAGNIPNPLCLLCLSQMSHCALSASNVTFRSVSINRHIALCQHQTSHCALSASTVTFWKPAGASRAAGSRFLPAPPLPLCASACRLPGSRALRPSWRSAFHLCA